MAWSLVLPPSTSTSAFWHGTKKSSLDRLFQRRSFGSRFTLTVSIVCGASHATAAAVEDGCAACLADRS